ncbi:MAG: DUF429 domain-containing protein [Myxococcales bacterium]|nr:DUF429 domain-containing protein [Myxococcales bacterium]
MTRVFHGIDFANVEAHHGQCWLVDDGTTLTARFNPQEPVVRTAVDCPFGTSQGFEALLKGEITEPSDDGFKTRATERLMRKHVAAFTTNAEWRAQDTKTRKALDRVSFFNGGAHVQPSVGLVIVPEFLDWLMGRLGGDSTTERLKRVREARLGEGPVVEAHPRLLLYSIIERVRLGSRQTIPAQVMADIGGYKDRGAHGEQGRRQAYNLLASGTAHWQPTGQARQIAVPDLVTMLAVDHAFDAWLAALTAWAHHHHDTWTWDQAGLPQANVEVEGHMLILKINGKTD